MRQANSEYTAGLHSLQMRLKYDISDLYLLFFPKIGTEKTNFHLFGITSQFELGWLSFPLLRAKIHFLTLSVLSLEKNYHF